MKRLTELNVWMSLQQHAQDIRHLSNYQLKKDTLAGQDELIIRNKTVGVDFSNQRLNKTILKLLLTLAQQRGLETKIQQLFNGESINLSENRPALHTALRQPHLQPLYVDQRNIIEDIADVKRRIRWLSDKIRQRQWFGFSGKPIKAIVNIGIGGSDLGPRLCMQALAAYTASHLSYHFISDADPLSFDTVINALEPDTTLFIICSKSFRTPETLANAYKALAWIDQKEFIDRHFIAVTANSEAAYQLNINTVLPLWPWVGGRFSFCSAINLITLIAIGYEHFDELLAGAFAMDQHFLTQELSCNLPVLLGLIGIWNINFLNINNLLILAYTARLSYFTQYIQQLDMESNGKSLDNQGRSVSYKTAPIVWGGLGNQAQHSYFQLLCQGTQAIAMDMVVINDDVSNLNQRSCDMKMQVLTTGINYPNNSVVAIPGNLPLNKISLASCSPFALGELIALYEHKIYVQSVIWDINPFDQPGVESAKQFWSLARV